MPVLLMARGDQPSRLALGQAIEARYGMRPPVLDSLQVDFEGRARIKLGFFMTWVPVHVTAYFAFPNRMRWDFAVRPVGVPIQKGIESYDGRYFRRIRGNGAAEVIETLDVVHSAQQRLWAVAALLLTPLGEHYVSLRHVDDTHFTAAHYDLGTEVTLALNADYTLAQVSTHCWNADAEQQQLYQLHIEGELANLNDILLPSKIIAYWNDEPSFEVKPISLILNPTIPDAIFELGNESA
ncbi:MAG: DUF6544 family protein [Phototrophicaceae bacterium]